MRLIFSVVCIGESKRNDTMHLLNDLRNLNYDVMLMTNIEFNLEKFQFDNVKIFKTDINEWNDFEKFKIIKHALNNNYDYVIYLDCDSRFFDSRYEKFNKEKFEILVNNITFDILCSWFTDPIRQQLNEPQPNENREIRNFKFGHKRLVDYLRSINKNYDNDLDNNQPIEGILFFKNNNKVINFINEMIKIGCILLEEDEKFGRTHKACASGWAMALMSNYYDIKIISDKITYYYFKPNFLSEVFPFNFKIYKEDKIYE